MKQLPSYGDERTLMFCAFCGGETGTRDHCPSRVFLDEPFPDNLPVVPCCSACNSSFSGDEEYFACLVSCVISGSTDPDAMPRKKTKRILSKRPSLRARIEQSRSEVDGSIIFSPENERVLKVVKKLAQGHALFELHESCVSEPNEIGYLPLSLMTDTQRDEFENPEHAGVWPEVGSRAMQRIIIGTDITPGGWIDIQPGRYRYLAMQGDGVELRMVIHEYLACQVRWEY